MVKDILIMVNTKLFERKIKYSDYNKGEVAKKVGISATTLYLIMLGKMLPNVETAVRLSNLLSFEIKDMWGV
jgi:DNA-binding XRE family transcriptional regulator